MIPWVRSLLIAQCPKSLSQEDFYPFLITPFGTLCLNRFSEKENILKKNKQRLHQNYWK